MAKIVTIDARRSRSSEYFDRFSFRFATNAHRRRRIGGRGEGLNAYTLNRENAKIVRSFDQLFARKLRIHGRSFLRTLEKTKRNPDGKEKQARDRASFPAKVGAVSFSRRDARSKNNLSAICSLNEEPLPRGFFRCKLRMHDAGRES